MVEGSRAKTKDGLLMAVNSSPTVTFARAHPSHSLASKAWPVIHHLHSTPRLSKAAQQIGLECVDLLKTLPRRLSCTCFQLSIESPTLCFSPDSWLLEGAVEEGRRAKRKGCGLASVRRGEEGGVGMERSARCRNHRSRAGV